MDEEVLKQIEENMPESWVCSCGINKEYPIKDFSIKFKRDKKNDGYLPLIERDSI